MRSKRLWDFEAHPAALTAPDIYPPFDTSSDDADGIDLLASWGCAPRKVVAFAPGGQLIARSFVIRDPDGYEVALLQRAG